MSALPGGFALRSAARTTRRISGIVSGLRRQRGSSTAISSAIGFARFGFARDLLCFGTLGLFVLVIGINDARDQWMPHDIGIGEARNANTFDPGEIS